MPLRSPAWPGHAREGALAAVFVRPLRPEAPVPADILAATYGLTAAQMRVVVGIVETGSVPETADALCLSEHTVRWHLKAIFEKTGVRSQLELVRLVASLAANPVR